MRWLKLRIRTVLVGLLTEALIEVRRRERAEYNRVLADALGAALKPPVYRQPSKKGRML